MANMDRYQIAAIQQPADGRRLARREPLSSSIYDVVVDMLMTRELPPGSRVNIDELSRTLGVSPTPVREALARVESDGLLTKEVQRGYTVAPLLGLPQLRDLLDLRMLIEPAAAGRAATRATAPETRALRTVARSTGKGGAGNTPGAGRIDMTSDARFHEMLATLSGNPLIPEMLSRMRSHVHIYRLSFPVGEDTVTLPEHLAIVDAIGRGDAQGAEHAMRLHLTSSLGRLESFLRRGTDSGAG